MTQIKLSILIPLYNYNEGFAKIKNCIENISDNLFNNYEIIISDDSELPIINNAEIKNLKNKLNHFRYIHNKERLGAVKNWNKLIKLSKGDYIWLLHQDEYWNKELNIVNEIIKITQQSNVDVLILPIIKINKIKIKNFLFCFYQKHSGNIKLVKKFIKEPELLFHLNIIGPPSCLILSKDFYKPFSEDLKFLVDVEFYTRIFKEINIKNVIISQNKNLNIFSSQNNSFAISKSFKNKKSLNIEELKYLKNKYKFTKKRKNYFFYFYYKLYCLISSYIKIEMVKK